MEINTQLALTGDQIFNRFYNGKKGGYQPNFIIVSGGDYGGSGSAGSKGGKNPLIKEITQSNDFLLDELKSFHTEMLASLASVAELLQKNNKMMEDEYDYGRESKKGDRSKTSVSLFGDEKSGANKSRVNSLVFGALSKHIPFLREGYFENLIPEDLKKPFEFMKQLNAARNEDEGKRFDRDSGTWIAKDAAPSDKKERKGMTKALTGLTSALLLKKKDDGDKKDGVLSTMLKMFLGGKILKGFLGGLAGVGKIFGMLALVGKIVLGLLVGIGAAIGVLLGGIVGFAFGDWLNKEFGLSEKLAPFFDTIFEAGEEVKKYVDAFNEKLTNLLEWLDSDARKKAAKSNPQGYSAEERQEMANEDIEKEFAMWKANNWNADDPVASVQKGAKAKEEIRKRIEKEYGITTADKEFEKARKEQGKITDERWQGDGTVLGWIEAKKDWALYRVGEELGGGIDAAFNRNQNRLTQEQAFKGASNIKKDEEPLILPDEITESQALADAKREAEHREAAELARKKTQLELAEAQKERTAQIQKMLREASVEEKVTAAKAKEAQPILLNNNQPITNVTNNNGGGAVSGIMQTRNTEDSYTSNVRSNKSLVFAS